MSSIQTYIATDLVQEIKNLVSSVFDIDSIVLGKEGEPVLQALGTFSVPPDKAFQQLAPRLGELRLTPLFRQDGERHRILIVPGAIPEAVGSHRLNSILLVLTVISTLFVGTMMVSSDPADFLRRPWLGLPFALSLLAILGAHELGHYFAARQYHVPVTLPYFIPMPLGPFGTLGAFISMKAPPPNRRALLAIAAAGPLSGFALALPILLLGLSMSPVTPLHLGEGIVMEGNSILYAFLKLVTFGRILPGGGQDVLLHPIAFAGWAGLLVTGLNLIPVGQLDGGHVTYALLGDKSRHLFWPVVVFLISLGMVWSGWFLWVVLLFVFGRRHAAPLDDLTPLTSGQRAIGWLVIFLFIIIFTPLPLTIY